MDTQTQEQLEHFDKALALLGCEVAHDRNGVHIRPNSTGIFQIQTKHGGLVTYVAKWEQCELYELIRRQIAAGLPALIIILKARQIGFSTAIGLLFEALALVRDAIDVLVASHEVKSQKRIWSIYKTAWRQLPSNFTRWKDPETGRMGPRARYDSRQELEFKDNNTHIGVYVAGKGELGRSGATHCAHLSEFARWKNQKEDLNSVMSSVPREGAGSIAVIETTANGWGDTFHEMWQAAEAAKAKREPHPWVPLFMPWWRESAYQSKPVKDFELDEAEQRLYDEVERRYGHRLNKAQLQWRRDKISGDCGGDVRLFDQENPSTPEHAFAATGENVFEAESLEYQVRKYVTDPIGYFEVELTRLGQPYLRPERFILDNKAVPIKGRLRLYRHPENRECLLMADPTHAVSDNSDPAAIHIIDVHTLEQLAVWEGRMEQHSFGDLCVALCRHFNDAFGVIESNIGLTTVNRMIELGYGNIHWHKPTGHYQADPTWQPGYLTSAKGRDEAIRITKRLADEKLLVLYDARTLHEMQAFQEVKTGTKYRAQAPKDKHDNLVMALAIGLHVGNGRYGWTRDGKLMRARKFKPAEIFQANPRPLHETPEQRINRMRRQNKRQRLQAAFDCT